MTRGGDYPLLAAAQLGDERAALRAIKAGAIPWARDSAGDAALVVAARFGHAEVCSVILTACAKAGKNPYADPLRSDFFSALGAACWKSRPAVTELLGKIGLERSAKDPEFALAWPIALNAALERSLPRIDPATLLALLRCGADANAVFRAPAGKRPLHLCALNGEYNLEAARVLLENGADPEGRDAQGQTPMHEPFASGSAWVRRCHPGSEEQMFTCAFVSLLSRFGASVEAPGREGKTPLSVAQLTGPDWLKERLLALRAAEEQSALEAGVRQAAPKNRAPSL